MGANVVSFDQGWEFCRTELSVGLEEALAAADLFRPVEIPHDWLIHDVKNLYQDGCGWYRKRFRPRVNGGPVILRFDGVYMDSTVYVNGGKVMDWKYGYSTFDADITEALGAGDNEVIVRVRFQAPNSRWYSGAGIYRRVWLKCCGRAWLPLDGTYVTIRPCGTADRFLLEARTETGGETENCFLRYSLWKDAKKVRDLAVLPCGEPLRTEVEQPLLWDVEDPQCYELLVELCGQPETGKELPGAGEEETGAGKEEAGTGKESSGAGKTHIVMDWDRITIGFRRITFDPDNGCFLNGRNLKIHGVCEHHDLGCLGAAFHGGAMARKLRMLKAMGVNAIRTSHNMQDPEFMELADRMGFLVVDEAFDMWEKPKTAYDYARFFQEWFRKDVRSWVRRDRNHPCVMLWSIGNEIYDTHAQERGQEITRQLAAEVREHDPEKNAPVTIGSNYMAWENARKCADIVKFAGYNYGEKYYEEQHREHPDWIMYGSETASLVQSRGIYHFPLKQPLLAEEDEQCSALGNSATSWGAKSLEQCIAGDREGYIFGQFLWTGFDYIGEPTPYHTKNSYFGQIDTAGFPKDAYYVFQAAWTDPEKAPMVHLFPYWDFNPGQRIDVRACTNGAAVELFVNGVSLGRQAVGNEKGKKLLGDWQVPYEPGMITAIAYDGEGREIARESRSSFGDSHAIQLTADREVLRIDENELCFLTIRTVDRRGNPVENAADYVRVDIAGPGRLLGMDNGDSTDYDQYKTNVRKLFSGKLLAVIGSVGEEGEIRVTVTGEGLEPARVVLRACLTSQRASAGKRLNPAETMSESMPGGGQEKGQAFCGEASCPGGFGEGARTEAGAQTGRHPVRKVELCAPQGQCITKDKSALAVEAVVYPPAAEPELVWKAVNESGIEIGYASVREASAQDGVLGRESAGAAGRASACKAVLTAWGDGRFYVRCMAREGGRVTLISQLEFQAQGLGQAFLNPYELVSAGLYTDTLGEIGNGNEKGIATARDGASGVVYEGIDFGEFGSDEITLPVFALSDGEYPIEIWLGKPCEPDSRLLDTVIYQKPSIWNTYQEETYRLPERIRGIAALGFVMRAKVHLKGFRFTRLEKAYERLWAAEADSVYGDSFRREDRAVRDIGNNVTLVYENMDFGERGTESVVICGRTPLERNSIHIHFTDLQGETVNRILEFAGGNGEETEQAFAIEKLTGRGRVEFIFLPGSCFDLISVRFERV